MSDKPSMETRHLNMPPEEPARSAVRATGPLDDELPWVIEFRVVGTASTIQAQVHETMLIGRSDPQTGVFPAVDLGPHGAQVKGVSRQHAVVLAQSNRIAIKDLDSVNGTRLNGTLLTPGQEYRMRHGDELEIGQVRLQVRFAVVPTVSASPVSKDDHAAIPVLGQGQRVLVVEDDDDVGKVFCIALEHAGFKVTVTSTATAALGAMTIQLPDIMVLDLMLPDMNGLDLLRYIRKEYSQRIPLVVVSGATGGFQMSQARAAGADTCLGKPISVDDLVKAVAAFTNDATSPSVPASPSASATPAASQSS